MGKNIEHEIILDLSEIFGAIKKRFWIVILIAVLAVGASAALSIYVMPPVYEAESSIIIGKERQEDLGDGYAYSYNDVMMYEKMLKTYGQIAKSRLVVVKASEKLKESGQTDLVFGEKEITVTPYTDTQILIIRIQDTNPNNAMVKVNILAQTFAEEANRIYPSGNVQVLDTAILPAAPVSPRTNLNMAVAFFLGIMVSLGIIFLIEYMDNTLKTEEEIEKYIVLPVIGLIPKETKSFR